MVARLVGLYCYDCNRDVPRAAIRCVWCFGRLELFKRDGRGDDGRGTVPQARDDLETAHPVTDRATSSVVRRV